MTGSREKVSIAVFAALSALLAALAITAAPPAAAAPDCENADARARTVSEAEQEDAVRCLINAERTARGLHTLKLQENLVESARSHSVWEAKHNCISHDCPGEGDFATRIVRHGYPACKCKWKAGEVIGWRRIEASTAREIVEAWMHSSAHKANLMTPSRREIGVGVVFGSPRAKDDDDEVEASIFTVNVGSRKPV